MNKKIRNKLLSRPPFERMLSIHNAINAGKFPNASSLSKELEVSSKTIVRDLQFMRDRLHLPLAYNDAQFGYYYTAEVRTFPSFEVTEGEVFALLVAEKAVQQYRGTTFEKPLISAFQKMVESLPETVSINLADWEQAISFRISAEPIIQLKIFDTLAKATARRKQVQLIYRKPGQSKPECRTVDPYHLANINGEWYLFAFDHLRNDLRTFVPARIQKVKFTGKTFDPPQKFSLAKTLQDSFGVVSGKGDYKVILRFDPWAADYIREKRWHPSQEVRPLPHGWLELRLRLSSLEEVSRWIWSWGGHAQVIAPPDLITMVRRGAEAILKPSLAAKPSARLA